MQEERGQEPAGGQRRRLNEWTEDGDQHRSEPRHTHERLSLTAKWPGGKAGRFQRNSWRGCAAACRTSCPATAL